MSDKSEAPQTDKNIHEPDNGAYKDDTIVVAALGRFRPIHSALLQWLVDILPLVILGFILVDALSTKRYIVNNPMFLSGLLVGAAVAVLFDMLLAQVPETLYVLWSRQIPIPRTQMVVRQHATSFPVQLWQRLHPKTQQTVPHCLVYSWRHGSCLLLTC